MARIMRRTVLAAGGTVLGALVGRKLAQLRVAPAAAQGQISGVGGEADAPGLRGMAEAYAAGRICAFTADGPKGPRRVAKAGPGQLAELAGAAWIGCFHAEPSRAWRLRSWDRFAVPKPFAQVRFGWPAHVLPPEVGAVQAGMDAAVLLAGEE